MTDNYEKEIQEAIEAGKRLLAVSERHRNTLIVPEDGEYMTS